MEHMSNPTTAILSLSLSLLKFCYRISLYIAYKQYVSNILIKTSFHYQMDYGI